METLPNEEKKVQREVNPGQKLAELKKDLKVIQGEINESRVRQDTLRNDIADLEKLLSEIKQILKSYDEAVEDLSGKKKDIEDYYGNKRPMIEAAIKEKKGGVGDVDGIVGEYEQKKSKVEEELVEQESKCKDAETKYEEAKAAVEEKHKTIDSLKGAKKFIGDQLKELSSLRGMIEQEEEKQTMLNMLNMYFLITELKTT
ncbi:MAG: coiled-coil domain-containing protein, partial [Candidatus Hodarchaeota archaeon]